MCTGDCANCGDQCPASKLLRISAGEQNNNTKGENTMSQAVGGCHAGADEKIGRLDERSQFSIERNNSCKLLCIVSLAAAIASAFIAWTAMRDVQNMRVDLAALRESSKQELLRISDKAEEAKAEATRGYNYIRKNKSAL